MSSNNPEQWRSKLSAEQFHVCWEKGTERPYSGALLHNRKSGDYLCVCCKSVLFHADAKFDSGCGWPAFSKPISEDLIAELDDSSLFSKRIEVRSSYGDAHLGHVFEDGPKETGGLRYCINSASLRFIPKDQMVAEGYGEWLDKVK